MKYTFLFFLISLFSFGQTVQVKGQIYDGEQPTEFTEIRLTNKGSQAVFQTYTQEQGAFTLSVAPALYQLALYQYNQEVYQVDLDLKHDRDLGKIVLEGSKRLEEVQIIAQKRLVERKIDRLVFNLEAAVVGSGGNVLEALKVTPGVRVSPSGISIIGKNQVFVLLDDRPTYLSGDELLRYLESVSSSDIKSIEVITTPPAKYEAEGNSGIINIITKKTPKDTWNAALSSTYQRSKRNTLRYHAGFNLNHKRWKAKATANFGDARFLRTWSNDLFYTDETWESRATTDGKNKYYNLNLDLSYQWNKNWEMGIKFAKNNYDFRGTMEGETKRFQSRALHSYITEDSEEQSKSNRFILSYFNEIKLDTVGKKLTLDLDYISSDQPSYRNFTSETLDPLYQNIPNSFLKGGNDNQNTIENYIGKLDLDLPFSTFTFTVGAKIATSQTKNKLGIYSSILSSGVQHNQFDYRENNQAVYVSGTKTWFDALTLQAGLRVEATQTKGYASALNQTNRNDYVKFFPTLYINYQIKEDQTLGFNYAKRINRPNFESLNPTRSTYNAYSYHEGNPFLKPAYTSNLELIYTYKKVESKLYYSHLKDGISQVSQINAETKHYNYIWMNYVEVKEIGLSESIYFKPTSWWNSANEFTLTYSSALPVLDNEARVKGTAAYFSTSNDFILNAAQTLFAGFNYTQSFKGVSDNFHSKAYADLNLNVKCLLLNKKLELSLQLSNVLNSVYSTYKETTEAMQRFQNHWDNRSVRFSAHYKLGNSGLKVKQRVNAYEEELERL
ncbi:TonB-dependent receptor domain-containing protein [Myroides sp. DW712]|uniref:TonB-dependent receptor domain-containing protein n=1 Tax=Myroides sp. DW712 TaxID=3389800 RepID=UPI0039782913